MISDNSKRVTITQTVKAGRLEVNKFLQRVKKKQKETK